MSWPVELLELAQSPAGQGSVDAFRSLHVAAHKRMLAGHELRLAEEELIEPATISTNRKAVLWLPASSPMLSGFQLAEIEAQIESLSDPCQERDEEEA